MLCVQVKLLYNFIHDENEEDLIFIRMLLARRPWDAWRSSFRNRKCEIHSELEKWKMNNRWPKTILSFWTWESTRCAQVRVCCVNMSRSSTSSSLSDEVADESIDDKDEMLSPYDDEKESSSSSAGSCSFSNSKVTQVKKSWSKHTSLSSFFRSYEVFQALDDILDC